MILKLKHLSSVLLITILLISVGAIIQTSALTETSVNNIGVTTEPPADLESTSDNYELYSVQRPSKVWNIRKKGRYNFAGNPGDQTLYTNYRFTGKTSYTVYIKNTGKYVLTVQARRFSKSYASTRISAGKSGSFTFSNIQKGTEFYIVFKGSSFSGYIQ